jgi:formate dehydrogenase maturation protein FdhE
MEENKDIQEKINRCPVCKVLVLVCEKSNDNECKEIAYKVIEGAEDVKKWVDYVHEKFKEEADRMLLEAIKEVEKEFEKEK